MVEQAYRVVYDDRKATYDTLVTRLTSSKSAADKKKLATLGKFPQKENTIAERLDYVSKLRCRFSNESSVVLASALDYVVQDLVRTAMVNARNQGKAIIKVRHVVQGDFSSVSMAPVVQQLDVIQDALKQVNEVKEVNEVKDGDAVEEVADDAVEEVDEVDDAAGKSNFKFYVNQICKSVKADLVKGDATYAPIRISQDIRKFGSDVVIQMIQRVAPLIKMYNHTADIKTVNDKVVSFIFNLLLTDARRDATAFNTFVNERLRIFRESRNNKNQEK
jgi:putative lipoic acid-binding regulatory protein